MGIFDGLADLADIAFDIVKMPFQIAGVIVDGVNDIAEYAVQTAVSGESETSYDVRDRAAEMVEGSRSRFFDEADRLCSRCSALKEEEEKTGELRKDVYELLGKHIGGPALPALPDFLRTWENLPSVPSFDTFSFNFGTLLGLAGTECRMEAAREYLARAIEFRDDVDLQIEEMRSAALNVDAVEMALKEEAELLGGIREACRSAPKENLENTASILQKTAQLGVEAVTEHTAEQYGTLLQKLHAMWP